MRPWKDLQEARQLDSDERGWPTPCSRWRWAICKWASLEQAAEALDEALHLCVSLDNPAGQAQVHPCAWPSWPRPRSDPAKALEHLSQAEELFRGLEDPGRAGLGPGERKGRLLAAGGDLAGAAAALEKALALAQDANDDLSQLLLYQYLAPLYRKDGQPEQALEAYRRLGMLSQKLNDPQREALALVGVGALLAQEGELEEADRALAGAEELFHRMALVEQARQVAAERRAALGEGK